MLDMSDKRHNDLKEIREQHKQLVRETEENSGELVKIAFKYSDKSSNNYNPDMVHFTKCINQLFQRITYTEVFLQETRDILREFIDVLSEKVEKE